MYEIKLLINISREPVPLRFDLEMGLRKIESYSDITLLESNWGSVSKLNCDQVLDFLPLVNVSRCASISWICIGESDSVNNVFEALVVNIGSHHWYLTCVPFKFTPCFLH